ncbi:hypothetical protein MWU54_06650 [Marivita sp. S6314]|uniref:hypothetical protein n=1 Tax=Marivita sp. S6314 TaxID=2926406 RepID=UPI001FF2B440|nr:hypothetical protein [Marivita sp. S6314]MCK0149695.1 hypothetical protein [Marivita sp. S6314]
MKRFAAMLCAAGLLAGCASDPLQGVPRLSEADVSEQEIQSALRGDAETTEPVVTTEPERRTGFFGRLLGGPAPSFAEPAETAIPTQTSEPEPVATAEATPPPYQPQGGLLGFLSRAANSARAAEDTDPVELAAAPPQTATDATPNRRSSRRGPKPGAPDYQVVEMGTVLPYGVLARVCNVRNSQLGKRVEQYPERRSAYAIYDSNPGNTAPHTFYVTGFDDGCVRQFTAALAMFGSPQTHEQLRYGLPSQVQPYSQTDAAYERLKSRVCRVGRGKPCGSAMTRLARNTVFVSVYERFGSNPVWKTILLHDGEVVETDIRSN